jgi:hypothetical protein
VLPKQGLNQHADRGHAQDEKTEGTGTQKVEAEGDKQSYCDYEK